MWFCTELYWHKWRPQCLGYSTKNHTGTNEVSMVYVVLQRIILVQLEIPGSMWFWYKQNHRGLDYSTKHPTGTNESSSVYVVLQRIILVQMDAPASMWFHNEPTWYKWRIQCLCGSIKNHTVTNSDSRVYFCSTKNHATTDRESRVYVVLQRIILAQIETSRRMWFHKESYWYKQRFWVYVVLQGITLVQMKAPVSVWFYKE